MRERRLLQICVAVGGLIPVSAGVAGILFGPHFIDATISTTFDSHFRYLSGLLLGVGIGFWSTIPCIEANDKVFRILTFLVFVGGIARLCSIIEVGIPSDGMLGALTMELGVTPLLCWWQWRISIGGA